MCSNPAVNWIPFKTCDLGSVFIVLPLLNMFLLSVEVFPTGCNVTVPAEVIVLNSIVLPYKDLPHSYKNEIIL